MSAAVVELRPRVEAATEIDWRRFVVDGRVSLRRLVEDGGLYGSMRKAVEALRAAMREDPDFCPERCEMRSHAGPGRPEDDWRMSYEDAIAFVARARTDVGRRVLRVLVSHHMEYQAVRSGDAAAATRLVDAMTPEARAKLGFDRAMERRRAADELWARGLMTGEERLAQIRASLADLDGAPVVVSAPVAMSVPPRSAALMAQAWASELQRRPQSLEWMIGRAAASLGCARWPGCYTKFEDRRNTRGRVAVTYYSAEAQQAIRRHVEGEIARRDAR